MKFPNFFTIFTISLLLFLTPAQSADKKISELNALTQGSWATGDLFPIVDVSATETKKTTVGDFDLRYLQLAGSSSVAGHISPGTDNTYDLGIDATNRWRNLYVAGAVKLGTVDITGALNSAAIKSDGVYFSASGAKYLTFNLTGAEVQNSTDLVVRPVSTSGGAKTLFWPNPDDSGVASDNIVARKTTDTLINKTLAVASNNIDSTANTNAVFNASGHLAGVSALTRFNTIYVDKNGDDATCVAANPEKACLTITQALTLVTSPVTTNRWIIQLGAGTFTEATLDLTRWTYIRGAFASMQGGVSRIIVTAGSIGVTSDWNVSATRGGLMDLYLSGSTGLNIDFQTVGGSSSEVFELTNVGMNGGIVFKGKNSLDYIQTNDVGVFGASTISGGSPTLQGALFFSSLTVNTSGSADAYTTMVNSAVFGNASFTSSGSNTTVVTANACTFLGTVTVDDAGTTFLHDAVSAPQASADLIVTNSGVVEQATRAHAIGYVPTTGADWVDPDPTTVQEALDTLAATAGAGSGGAAINEVFVQLGNGHGSTNTKIRRFSNVVKNVGAAITYADSSTDGASFTIQEKGIYAITYWDAYSAAATSFGITLNSSQLTTSIDSLGTPTEILVLSTIPAAAFTTSVSVTRHLAIGDVIRAHDNGNNNSTSAITSGFSITKVNIAP